MLKTLLYKKCSDCYVLLQVLPYYFLFHSLLVCQGYCNKLGAFQVALVLKNPSANEGNPRETGHRLGGINNRNLSSHSSGDQKVKTKILIGLVSCEAPLLPLQMAVYWLCLYMVICVCVCVCVLISYEDASRIGLEPTSMTSFNPITYLETLSLNIITSEVLEIRTSTQEFSGAYLGP